VEKVNGIALALKLARLRAQPPVGLRELARREQLSATFLSRCENGHESPSERILRIYADSFGVDFDELCKLSGRVPSDVAHHLLNAPGAVRRVRKEMKESG
jgi:transcriptional regulator with XRE-family HTH domain